MSFAGQTERMAEDYATLLRRLELDETEPPTLRNAHPYHEIVSFLEEDRELIEKISGKTRYDRALHHYAGSLLGRNIAGASTEISRLNLENADLSAHAQLLRLFGECQATRHSLEAVGRTLKGETKPAMTNLLRQPGS